MGHEHRQQAIAVALYERGQPVADIDDGRFGAGPHPEDLGMEGHSVVVAEEYGGHRTVHEDRLQGLCQHRSN